MKLKLYAFSVVGVSGNPPFELENVFIFNDSFPHIDLSDFIVEENAREVHEAWNVEVRTGKRPGSKS